MEPHLSSLQDIVRLTIRQELEWSERRFKRITMSHDASDNPAELYGADGKIYYRKAGGAGVEIGGGLWGDTGTYAKLLTVRPIDMQYESIIHVDEIVGGIAAGGFNVSAIYGEPLKIGTDHGYTTIEDTTQSAKFSPTQIDFNRVVDMNSQKITNLATATDPSDAARFDQISGGGATAHSALTELDYASAAHTGFTGNPAVADLDMDGHDITELSQMYGKVESGFSWDLIFYGSNVGGTAAVEMMRWDASVQNINVAGKKITNLAAGTNASDAARFDQLGGGGATAHSALTQLDYASAGHTGFAGNPLTASLDVAGYFIDNVFTMQASGLNGITIQDDGGTIRAYLANSGDSCHHFSWPIDMNNQKITNLAAGTNASDAARFDQLGGGGATAHSALTQLDYASAAHTGFSPDTHTHDDRYYTETEIGTWRNSVTQTEMGYVHEVSSSIQDQLNARLLLTAGSGEPLTGDLYIGNNDIIDCKDIKGDTTGTNGADRLNLDFRGDGVHRIYYTGVADNRLGYKTFSSHAFAIGANVTASIDANGIIMNTGKYIKSVSGDLELRAPSGSMIKFVIG